MNSITIFKIVEAASTCGINENEIRQFIEEKWIVPYDSTHLFLDEEDIERIKLISELQAMGVNDESVPIILHLIDQLNLIHHGLGQN